MTPEPPPEIEFQAIYLITVLALLLLRLLP